MSKFNKGIVPLIAIIIIVAVFIVGGGVVYYYYFGQSYLKTQQTQEQQQNTQNQDNLNTPNNEPFITVLSPNRGETLELGKTYIIKWDSIGIGNISIEIVHKSVKANLITIATNIANTGSYSWTVPLGRIAWLPQKSDFIIRIISENYPYTYGEVGNINFAEPKISPCVRVHSQESANKDYFIGKKMYMTAASGAMGTFNSDGTIEIEKGCSMDDPCPPKTLYKWEIKNGELIIKSLTGDIWITEKDFEFYNFNTYVIAETSSMYVGPSFEEISEYINCVNYGWNN